MRISNDKKAKISEQILAFLYSASPKSFFTSQIAEEVARDEEFIKVLLYELKKKSLIVEIKKNPQGIVYSKRSRWRMSDSAYQAYKGHQISQN
jgi:predicted transcriptional regulator with HTH domain